MDDDHTETLTPDRRDGIILFNSQNLTGPEFIALYEHLSGNITQYVQQNKDSTNTELFSYLALLNAYVPGSFLLMSECQKVLGPPDPIDGGPPFEERMEPFTALITTSSPSPGHVGLIHPVFAQTAVNILADAGISRSTTVKKLMISLCGDEAEQDTVQFIKDLLTKREFKENRKQEFSSLIEDIQEQENSFYNAVSVMKTASNKFRHNSLFPQTASRLLYIKGRNAKYDEAETWAREAIKRAPHNSYVWDTLGQIFKNRLFRGPRSLEDIISRANKAFRAFKDVEEKADAEEGPVMWDAAGAVNISDSFNNRGRFGFLRVAKITFEKLGPHPSEQHAYVQKYKTQVEDKFEFFEWYLTYSQPDMETSEPPYFWKEVALCYKNYTNKRAADSTSFAGLLDSLNRGLFTSKWRRARLPKAEKTVSDLEKVRNDLKTNYEADVDDVEAAERYILSNIILANLNSRQLTPVEELKEIIHRFLGTDVGRRSCEFYLLVLLLFWPGGQPQVVREEEDEEVEQHSTEDEGSDARTWEDEEDEEDDEDQEAEGETAQVSSVQILDPNLQNHVTFMIEAFMREEYAKYLRGRYLLPLFFLGKGSGLSRWIHKSKLDKIVEEKVNAEIAADPNRTKKKKKKCIDDMWVKQEVWQVPKIQDLLLPVQVEPCCHAVVQDQREVLVCVGGQKIRAKAEPNASPQSRISYLGFTINGPVVFSTGFPFRPEQ